MTPTTTPTTKTVTRTVFDLEKFDDVKLTKEVQLPAAPASVADALSACGNDESKLLKLIYEGMTSETVETARNDISGFRVVNEDDEPGDSYTGKFADESKSKAINLMVLNTAKVAFGYGKDQTAEQKRASKASAIEAIRSNPAIVKGLAG